MNSRISAALLLLALWGVPLPERVLAEGVNLTLCVTTLAGDGSACIPPVLSGGGGGGSSGGGGGGGGGGGIFPSIPNPTVTFDGIAYPGSQLVFLRNGVVVATVPASPDARFSTSLSGLAPGTYTFGIYAVDANGSRSPMQTFSTTITAGVNTGISGIFLPPTIAIDKSSVKHGEPLTIIGFAPPASHVTVEVNSDTELFLHATSSPQGLWRYVLDTTELDLGQHSARAQAAHASDISGFSDLVRFTVGTQTIVAKKSACGVSADLNKDCRVQLVDFSMLAFWYRRPLTDSAKTAVDLNHDGVVNIVDFSIMAYHWTG